MRLLLARKQQRPAVVDYSVPRLQPQHHSQRQADYSAAQHRQLRNQVAFSVAVWALLLPLRVACSAAQHRLHLLPHRLEVSSAVPPQLQTQEGFSAPPPPHSNLLQAVSLAAVQR